MPKQQKETLLEKERFELGKKSGGGLLSYEAWGYEEDGRTVVTRYHLAYVNHAIYPGDNGRVLGFDNAHGYHHKHFKGCVEPVAFESYEAQLERFQKEWQALIKQLHGGHP